VPLKAETSRDKKKKCAYCSHITIGLAVLLNRLDNILNNLLRITEDHHGFIHVEELVIKASKNKDLERHKKNKKN
jgi:hypothetical protein